MLILRSGQGGQTTRKKIIAGKEVEIILPLDGRPRSWLFSPLCFVYDSTLEYVIIQFFVPNWKEIDDDMTWCRISHLTSDDKNAAIFIFPIPQLSSLINKWRTAMNFLLSLLLAAFAIVGLSSTSSVAFQITRQPRSSTSNFSKTGLHSKNCDDDGRRTFLSRSAASAMSVLVGGTCFGQPAAASYTAYARREDDWKERAEKGGESLLRVYSTCSYIANGSIYSTFSRASISHPPMPTINCHTRCRGAVFERATATRTATRDRPDER